VNPVEATLQLALERRLVAPQQVAQARADVGAGRAPSALAALAARLDPGRRDALTRLYHEVQQRGQAPVAGTLIAPPPVAGTLIAPPPVAGTLNAPPPVAGTLITPPSAFALTVQASPPGVAPTVHTSPPGVAPTVHTPGPIPAVAPTVDAPGPPPAFGAGSPVDAAAPTRPGVEHSLADTFNSEASGPGQRVGEFEVVREIARGGVGVVYLARHPTLERLVALKLLLPQGDVSEDALRRFKLEAQVASRLQHPNIVRIFQDGHDQQGRYYFAMDFIEGPSLVERIQQQGPLPSRDAAQLMLPLAEALAHAHRQSVLHRDLKPHNVLIRASDETPFLTDFGLAKDVGGKAKTLTVAGNIMGTPAYMPPEQAGGETDLVDRRSDVYSFGATLYHALTGEPPFAGQTLANILTAVLTKDPVPPRKRVKGVDPDLETICLTCLEKEPERRYATAQALADDLRRFLDDEPIQAKPPGPIGRARKWARRNRAAALTLLVASALLLVGGVGGGVYLLRERGRVQREARVALILEHRTSAEEALEQLDALEDERVEDRLAAALDALSVAQQYYGVAEDKPHAGELSCRAALALTEAAIAGRQLTLAARGLSLAEETGALPEHVAAAAAELERVQRAPVARAREILDGLGGVRRPGWRERAVLELSREANPEVIAFLVTELERFDLQLKASTKTKIIEVLQQAELEGRAGLDSLLPAWERNWELAPGATLAASDREVLKAAESWINGRFAESLRDGAARQRAYKNWRDFMLEGQELLDGARGEVIASALSRLPEHEDPKLRRVLSRYLWHMVDELRLVYPARELLLGGVHADYLHVIFGRLADAHARGPLRVELEPFVTVDHMDYFDSRNAARLLGELARGGQFAEAEAISRRFAQDQSHEFQAARCRLAIELGDLDTSRRYLRKLEATRVGKFEYMALELKDLENRFAWDQILERAPALESVRLDESLWAHAEAWVDVLESVGNACSRMGRFQDAEECGRTITALSPQSGAGYRVFAYSLLARNEPQKALYTARQALATNNDAALREIYALALLQTGSIDEAEGQLRLIVNDLPHNRNGRLLYATLLAQRNEIEKARVKIEEALRPYPAWVPGLIARVRVEAVTGNEALARETYAEIVRRVGDRSAEVGLLKLALERAFGGDGKPVDAQRPDDLFAQAQRAARAGDYTLAVRILEQLTRLAPAHQPTYFQLAFILYSNLQDYERAEPHARRAVELDPNHVKSWNLLGAITSARGDDVSARIAFERVIELQPNEAMAHNNLGWLDRSAGKFEQALAHYDRSIELMPNLPLARCNRASLLFELGRVEAALEDYAVAVGASPGDGEIRMGRAEVFLTLGRDEEAVPDLEVAARGDAYAALLLAGAGGSEDPVRDYAGRPGGHWVSALCQAWLGELAERDLLARAGEEPEQEAGRLCELHFYLGWKAEGRGQRDAARAHYEQCLAQDKPDFMEHGLAKVRLERLGE